MREIMAEFPAVRTPIPRFDGDVVRDREIAARLHRFHTLSEPPGSSMPERETHHAEALVLLVSRHATPSHTPRRPGTERNAVRIGREYLDGNAGDNVTLQTLAQVAGLSPFHLCRVFRDTIGMTPHAYLTHIRIRHAKSLLRTGLPNTQVATQVGFYEQAHLTRHFKRIVGVPPGQYVTDATT
jgi:AraC-like DNA-binding protein